MNSYEKTCCRITFATLSRQKRKSKRDCRLSNGHNFIILKFGKPANDGKQIYFYNYESAGKQHVEKMKELALKGEELNTYKNQHRDIDFYAYWDDKKKRFELKKEFA